MVSNDFANQHKENQHFSSISNINKNNTIGFCCFFFAIPLGTISCYCSSLQRHWKPLVSIGKQHNMFGCPTTQSSTHPNTQPCHGQLFGCPAIQTSTNPNIVGGKYLDVQPSKHLNNLPKTMFGCLDGWKLNLMCCFLLEASCSQ